MTTSKHTYVKRSAAFYWSDVRTAAEDAAQAVADHGLDPDAVAELTEDVETAIHNYFRETRDRVPDKDRYGA